MRGVWNFTLLLGILVILGFQLTSTAPTFENDGESDTLEKLREFEEDREKDREKLKKETVSKLHGDIPNPGELFEGDIIMDESLRKAVLGEADKRSVFRNKKKLWPEGIVYYTFDRSIAEHSKVCVLAAMKTFHQHTCIRFVRRTNQPDYLYIKSTPNSCMSYVGRKGGKQSLVIGHGCTRLGTCQHELLHALGTIHEQSRPDRDNHVKIVWDNIRKSESNNFNKYSYQTVTDEGIEYDFMSVMHYPNEAFAIDRSMPTIISKKDPELVFGQRRMFSQGDVMAINRLYKCPKDQYFLDLPEILSDADVEQQRDIRKQYSIFE